MKRHYNVIIEQDEDGHTQAKSLDKLRERIKEAIELYLEVEKDVPEELNFIGIQKVEVQA
jgi:predicted RNase H-like HicB family nuclease